MRYYYYDYFDENTNIMVHVKYEQRQQVDNLNVVCSDGTISLNNLDYMHVKYVFNSKISVFASYILFGTR